MILGLLFPVNARERKKSTECEYIGGDNYSEVFFKNGKVDILGNSQIAHPHKGILMRISPERSPGLPHGLA